MLFVLQDCQKVSVGGNVLKEDLGSGESLRPSGSDERNAKM